MDLSKVVDSLEHKIGLLLRQQEELKSLRSSLEAEVEDLKKQILLLEKDLLERQDQINSLKYSNSLLGSDQYKRETKLKINALIREIDQCIAQLSP